MSKDRNLYQNLITSLFPSIHGNNEVKRGILLMLFGGVAKNTIEGTFFIFSLNDYYGQQIFMFLYTLTLCFNSRNSDLMIFNMTFS